MKSVQQTAVLVLVAVFLISLSSPLLAPAQYDHQFREMPNASPSRQHPLGTDDLGRDSFSRLLYGSCISLLLAPAAAFLATVSAALIGGCAGYLGGNWERVIMSMTDLALSLPWFFLLLTARALLPLNVSPLISVVLTFALLGLLGWPASARVICAGVHGFKGSDIALQSQAWGCSRARVLLRHLMPNLKPLLYAQFWISIPVFILAEANLGMLGLGVSEPLPSWGGLLRDLEDWPAVQANPWRLAPLFLLVIVVSCLQVVLPSAEALP